MSDILDSIRALGIDALHQRTKISPQNLKALLDRDFSKFRKVQFLGFVSILERDFNLDLSSYKDEYFALSDSVREVTPEIKSFISEKESKEPHTNRKIIIFSLLGLFLIGFFAYKVMLSNQESTPLTLNDTAIIEAKEHLVAAEKQELLIQQRELNATQENNATQEIEEALVSKVIILPKRRLWMGLINTENGKRIQEIIDSGYELNTSTSWLIVFGHGHLDIEYNKELLEYTSRKKLWFVYQEGQLQEINKEEFRRKNGGKTW
jgi:cytoskeletal protein RodZ